MKIYLYLKDKIAMFSLPKKVSGSFSFDNDNEEETKLINIKAVNNKWFIYSTDDAKIIDNNSIKEDLVLEENTFYTIKRQDVIYLIYVCSSFDSTFISLKYDKNLNLIIGNDDTCNIKYNCPYIKNIICKAIFFDNKVTLNISNNIFYINNKKAILEEGRNDYFLNNGDELHLFGLKIFFYNGFMLINNPSSRVTFKLDKTSLVPYKFIYDDNIIDFEVKDEDLYEKDDYFSKAPRVRRTITTKNIDLSLPPRMEGEKELPLILTVGPMVTMAIASGVMLISNISKLITGETTLAKTWPTLISSGAMLISMVLWPSITKSFNKKIKASKEKEILEKYTKYLEEKRNELTLERSLQREILIENLISIDECLNIIKNGKLNFWDKRIEQSDFLTVRIGVGNELLDIKINYPEEGFTIDEDELKKKADFLFGEFKYIHDVPIGYSLYKGKITAIMGDIKKSYGMINNIILQLITFYSYEDIKLVVMTNKDNEDKWQYVKYLNHAFSNDKQIRFFSTNVEGAKNIGDYLNLEIQNRLSLSVDGPRLFKPYYVIITDDYEQIKKLNVTKILTENDINLGFSLVIIENQMSRLPSKCNNFINLGVSSSGLLKNSFENQEQATFTDEIKYDINMMDIATRLSNIPIEFEENNRQLPETITFLEMEHVGKVEQLNIMNRWDSNDSTTSLKAEVGVDSDSNPIYLDLHEKYHGPHGLIAGMTGSGKSEFIITYILSMAINYSPDDVAFILIDYKGGGLAFAFENKTTGVCLPHLAGTITNLDKSEMDRTLVSIDSEIKRRQKIFNDARDKLGESTMDIYKYQRMYKDGKLNEPVPHLLIICDEFAELKSQQPDFMSNLISVARIGRSLGVHLILATQKPSGVVDDQIWSNTKFRVCLKVQDASDSKEMLKKADAASLKQTGRFYLQVGYDEYFILGQSAWCGAKYYPSEKIIKQVDKSVNFINDTGNIIKSIQSGNNIKIEPQGEQLANIMQNIIEVARSLNKKAKRLWLNDIDPIILVDNLEQKYHVNYHDDDIKAILGEYDAPERQEQGILTYSLKNDGNIIIYGNDEMEKENLLNSLIYSVCKNYSPEEVNIYIVDYGSESLRLFDGINQIGGLTFMGEDEGIKNLFKLIIEEVKTRKKLFIPYGGSLNNYNDKNEKKLPIILFILNNYEGLLEVYNNIYEDIISIGRDCERYGINLILTCNAPTSIGRRVSQIFNKKYALHLADSSDYYTIFNMKVKIKPRDILGRGLIYNDAIHEFQTSSIVEDSNNLNDYISKLKDTVKDKYSLKAERIPTLPDVVSLDIIKDEISTLDKVPIGISKDSLKIIKYDFLAYQSTSIVSNKLKNINCFIVSLCDTLLLTHNVTVFFVDTLNMLELLKKKNINNKRINYFNDSFDKVMDAFISLDSKIKQMNSKIVYIIYGLEKLKAKVEVKKLETLFGLIKNNDNTRLIICDSGKSLKSMDLDVWYAKLRNNTDGIWIGKGFADQQNFRISKITKEMNEKYTNDYGFYVSESSAELVKLLEFNDLLKDSDDDEE